ncbi:MAG: efflux transporter outer membrane subunit [Candidatus Binatia bacterium]
MRPVGRRVAAACFVALFAAVLTGCPVGPDFVKPDPPLPVEYRSEIEPATAASFADLPWWDVFDDEILRSLVTEGLQNNYDLRTAVYRVEQAEHQVGVARSEIYPQASYQGAAQRGQSFVGPGIANPTFNTFLGSLNLAWEIDVWGRIRRASEASMADLLATNDFRRAVVLSLVSGIATQYFQLQELDLELDIARRTTASFDETVQLFTRRFKGGVDSLLSVERAKAARGQAAAAIPQLEQAIVIQENVICILLGRPPGSVPRKPLLTRDALPPQAPAGLPSELLRRRPDILQAEEQIRSANAQIGVNVANFFPRIGLTTLYGGQSSDLENVVKTPGVIWAIAGSMLGPLFQGGRLIENYRGSVANWEATQQQYEQTVVTALAEVSNALIAQQKLEQVRAEQITVVDALRESVRLALLRYNGGLSTYFEVLEAQQQLFPAENALAQTDRDRLLAVVDLYGSLGGGWEADDGQPIDVPWWPAGP